MPSRKTKPRVTPERAARVLDILEETHPEARCALAYRNAFELAVATILSAQCTDERVNRVTPLLFERYPDAGTLARAPLADVEEIIDIGDTRDPKGSQRGIDDLVLRRQRARMGRGS